MKRLLDFLQDNFNFTTKKSRRYFTVTIAILLSVVTLGASIKKIFDIDVLSNINNSLDKKRFAEAYGVTCGFENDYAGNNTDLDFSTGTTNVSINSTSPTSLPFDFYYTGKKYNSIYLNNTQLFNISSSEQNAVSSQFSFDGLGVDSKSYFTNNVRSATYANGINYSWNMGLPINTTDNLNIDNIKSKTFGTSPSRAFGAEFSISPSQAGPGPVDRLSPSDPPFSSTVFVPGQWDWNNKTVITNGLPIDIYVLQDKGDINLDNISITAVTVNGTKGNAVKDISNKKIRYTPNAGQTGDDTFTYTYTDGNGNTNTEIVTVKLGSTVGNVTTLDGNDYSSPELHEDIVVINPKETTITFDPLRNDILNEDRDQYELRLITPTTSFYPSYITGDGSDTLVNRAIINSDKSLTINTSDLDGRQSLKYEIFKAGVLYRDSHINFIRLPDNNIQQGVIINEDNGKFTSYTKAIPENSIITEQNLTAYSKGLGYNTFYLNNEYTIQSNSSPTYLNQINFFDQYNCQVEAQNDNVSVALGSSVNIPVLSNDADYEYYKSGLDSPVTVTIDSPPSYGTAVVNSDNTITYTSTLPYSGNDYFNYKVVDTARYGQLQTDSVGNVNIAIDNTPPPANQLPTVTSFSKVMNENTTLNFTSSDFNSKYSDTDTPDPDTLTKLKITQLPTHGTVKLNTTNITLNQEINAVDLANIKYTPNTDYTGTDLMKWNASDGTDYALSDTNLNIYIINGVQGKLYSWGYPGDGALGIENSTNAIFADQNYPTLVPTLADKTITKLASTATSTVALTNTGDVYAWGYNKYKTLGLGDITYPSGNGTNNKTLAYEPLPVKVAISDVKDISSGLNQTLFLKTDGTVWASGGTFAIAPELYNVAGQPNSITSPIQIPTLTNIVSVAANEQYSIALDSSGKVYMFGDGCQMYKEGDVIKNIIGTNYTISNSNCFYPTTSNLGDSVVPFLGPDSSTVYNTGGKAIKSIFAPNSQQAAAVDIDGEVWLWGKNRSSQLYINPTANPVDGVIVPTKVITAKNIIKVAGSNCAMMALSQSGDVYAWGNNCSGQFGNGGDDSDPVALITNPLLIASGKKDIAVGDGTTLLLDNNGKVQSAGYIGLGSAAGRIGTQNAFLNVKTDSSEVLDFSSVVALTSSWSSSFALSNITPPQNQLPTVTSFSKSMNENNTLTFTATDFNSKYSDTDTPDPDTLTKLKITQLPTHGTLKLNTTNITLNQEINAVDLANIKYTPITDYTGTDLIKWNATDGTDYATNTADINITVNNVNQLPTVTSFSKSMNENNTLTFTATDFNSKYSDTDTPDPDTLTKLKITQLPTHGTLKLNTTNITLNQEINAVDLANIKYTPITDYTGTDLIKWNATDGTDYATNTADINITVNNVNQLPVANPDTATVSKVSTIGVLIPVLTNDTDPDIGETANLSICSNSIIVPANSGTATIVTDNGTQKIKYIPKSGATSGTITFTYKACDTSGGQSLATNVTVTLVNQPPIGQTDTTNFPENTTKEIEVLVNDSDPDTGDSLTLSVCEGANAPTLVNPPAGTTIAVSADKKKVVITPPNEFNGLITYIYRACDSEGLSSPPITSTATVTNVNKIPVANPDQANIIANNPITISVLANDTDPDTGETATLTICSASVTIPTSGGNAIITGTGNNAKVIFTPKTNFTGTDIFSYRACDINNGQSNLVNVSVTITAPPIVNQPPVANPDTTTFPENTIKEIEVLVNDTDEETSTLTICLGSEAPALVNPPSGTTLTVSADKKKVVITPPNEFNGLLTYTYKACDKQGLPSNKVTSTAIVTNVNKLPVANPDTTTFPENTTKEIEVLVNDTDADQGQTATLTICVSSLSSLSPANSASMSLSPDKKNVVITPIAEFTGNLTFKYKACDTDGGQSNEALVTATVTNTNKLPVANPDTASVNQDSTTGVEIDVLANDTDADPNQTNSLIICANSITNPTNGTITIVGTGADAKVKFIPTSGYYGVSTFKYKACDTDGGQSNEVTVTINVNQVVTPPTPTPTPTPTQTIKLALKKDTPDSQIQIGTTFTNQADITNPNPIKVFNVKTIITVDATKLDLISDSAKEGSIASLNSNKSILGLLDILKPINASAQTQGASVRIISDNQIEVIYDSMEPNQTKSIIFQTKSKITGDTEIKGTTQIGPTGPTADAILPIKAQEPVRYFLVRTGGTEMAWAIAITLSIGGVALWLNIRRKDILKNDR